MGTALVGTPAITNRTKFEPGHCDAANRMATHLHPFPANIVDMRPAHGVATHARNAGLYADGRTKVINALSLRKDV